MFFNRRFALLRSLAIIGAVLALLAFSGVRPAHGVQTFIDVDSTADDNTANGNCTLREAIIAANTNTAVDHCFGNGGGLDDIIEFGLPATDPDFLLKAPVINIGATPLPDITERVHMVGISTIPNGPSRVEIHGPGGPLVGGHAGLTISRDASGTEIDSMVINNSADDGVLIQADEVTLYDDLIGTDWQGEVPVPNLGFGVQVEANGDRIGSNDTSNCPYGCDLIAGNAKGNILLDTTASGARVLGIHVGTDITGSAILPGDSTFGIIDKGSFDRIGDTVGTTPGSSCNGSCNVIIGIPEAVLIDTPATNSRVQGNFIGINGGGDFPAAATANYGFGIVSKADGVMIGGTTPEARNVIAGASNANIIVEGHNSIIEGNYIGTKSSGQAAIAGGAYGVQAYQAVGAVIGGAQPRLGNVIAGAELAGVDIYLSSGVLVVGNFIGTADDGESPLPNGHFGVSLEQGSSSNYIGGTADGTGNTIANNEQSGVWMDGSVPVVHSNPVRRNSIYSNGTGIDLEGGANDNILPPAITGKNPLTGTACANCAVEIFSDAGNEGKKFEGTALVNGTGSWTFGGSLSGPNATATATDGTNNTSAFSEPFIVSTPTPSPSPTPSASPSPHKQGDLNCDGMIDDADFEYLLKYVAGLNDGMTSDCYTLGGQGIGPFAWGDLNCDGSVDAVDALFLLEYRAGIFRLTSVPCTVIGQGFA